MDKAELDALEALYQETCGSLDWKSDGKGNVLDGATGHVIVDALGDAEDAAFIAALHNAWPKIRAALLEREELSEQVANARDSALERDLIPDD